MSYAITGTMPRSVELDFDTDGFLLYIGVAAPGSSTASPVWQIRKFNYDAYRNITSILYANGNPAFDQTWDGHAALTYS